MLVNFEENFLEIKEFDGTAATQLRPFFDVDFVARDRDQYVRYFQNLSRVAYQNLGLAHCVIHNQSAHNVIKLALAQTNFDCYRKPYADHVGAFSFRKPPRTDNVVMQENRVQGIKKWASHLHNADFFVFRIADASQRRRWLFVDLRICPQKIINLRDNQLGMNVARPADIELDIDLPKEWIVDEHVANIELQRVLNFHAYGLITNYNSNARALLDQATKMANKYNYNVEYNLKSLDLQVKISEGLWTKNIDSVLEDYSDEFWRIRDSQYEFAKKNLIDIIHFCLQIFNTDMFDIDNADSQVFRDALIFSSHRTHRDVFSNKKNY